jgi:hypothetical protein
MRRLGVAMLALALAVPVMGFAFLQHGAPAAAVRLALPLLGLAGPAPAAAQTTMTFENVPPESAAALEVRTGKARTSRVKVTVSTDGTGGEDTLAVTEQVVRSGDVTRIGDDIHIKENEVVHGDVVTVMGGDAIVDGTVHGDVVAVMGGDVYLNATARVDGDVVCMGGELHEEPGAFVSGKKVTGHGGDIGVGRRFWGGRDWESGAEAYGLWGGLRIVKAFFGLLFAIGFAMLVAWLFQSRIAAGVQTMRRQPALSFGVGALVLALIAPSAIALAVVSVLLVITLIGIPLAVAAWLGYALFFVVLAAFGLTIGATVVGEWLASRRGEGRLPVWQYALFGVLLLGGVRFVGRMFEVVGVFGFHALGTLLIAVAVTATAILGMIGGGAWLKWEFSEGLFGQWWGRWQGRNGRVVPAPAAPAAGPAAGPASAPPPPAPGGSAGPEPPPEGPAPTPGT